jgi:hypothetical protein
MKNVLQKSFLWQPYTLTAKRMLRSILPSVACPPVLYFSTLAHKRYDFRENLTEHKLCALILSTTFVWNVSHFKKNSAKYYLLFMSNFN